MLSQCSCGIVSVQILSGTAKPTGLARKRNLHTSLERDTLWGIEKEEDTTRGIGAEIALIGRPAVMMSDRSNARMVNYAMNVGPGKRLVLVNHKAHDYS